MATHRMPQINPMPAMPGRGRKHGTPRACTCGCGGMTKGGRYIPGHDARHRGWAIRIARGFDTTGITPGELKAATEHLRAGHWDDLSMPAPKRAARTPRQEAALDTFTPPAGDAASEPAAS